MWQIEQNSETGETTARLKLGDEMKKQAVAIAAEKADNPTSSTTK